MRFKYLVFIFVFFITFSCVTDTAIKSSFDSLTNEQIFETAILPIKELNKTLNKSTGIEEYRKQSFSIKLFKRISSDKKVNYKIRIIDGTELGKPVSVVTKESLHLKGPNKLIKFSTNDLSMNSRSSQIGVFSGFPTETVNYDNIKESDMIELFKGDNTVIRIIGQTGDKTGQIIDESLVAIKNLLNTK